MITTENGSAVLTITEISGAVTDWHGIVERPFFCLLLQLWVLAFMNCHILLQGVMPHRTA